MCKQPNISDYLAEFFGYLSNNIENKLYNFLARIKFFHKPEADIK